MLNLKKEASQLEIGELKVANCPICKAYVSHQYYMKDAPTQRTSKWFSCSCGIVFQNKFPDGVYDKKYWDSNNKDEPKIKEAYEYAVKVYAPIIEELVYGRKMLMIGQVNPYQKTEFERRGWVPTIIDKNIDIQSSDRYISADFEKYNFKESEKFNLIWIYQTLECFNDPIASLELCEKLSSEDAILFISSPDTDFINTRSSSNFVHWKAEYNHIMWNRRSMTRHLENLGFNVILSRQNYEYRFPVQDDFHIIAQLKFF
jgi:hypothetical protein